MVALITWIARCVCYLIFSICIIAYWRRLRGQRIRSASAPVLPAIYSDLAGYIKSIGLQMKPTDSSWTFPRNQNAIVWEGVAELGHLEVLDLYKCKIAVSMDDIQKLSQSVKSVTINHNFWTTTTGNVDLSLLPTNLERFSASACKEMNGKLKWHAPHSNLVDLSLGYTALHLEMDPTAKLPPSLKHI